jgi:signal transduction histidine kinase
VRLSPRAFDTVLVGVLVALTQAETWLGPFGERWALSAVCLAMTVPLLARRTRPLAACGAVVAVLAAGQAWLGTPTEMASGTLPLLVAVYTAGAWLVTGPAVGFLLGALAAVGLAVHASPEPATASNYVYAGMLVGIAWSVGRVLSRRHAQVAVLEDAAAHAAAEAVERERGRIARELHDVVAHGVSVMVLQAGAAKEVLTTRPDDARIALEAVQEAGRAALVELRRMLDLLRDEDGQEDGLRPQQGLADLPALASTMTAAGLRTELVVSTSGTDVPPAVGLSAYRIVQEALTNALKHAGPATATVTVRTEPGALLIEVADNGRGRAGTAGGYGLVGMRERVGVFGGHLEVLSSNGFTIRATLPLRAAA